jgi:hypothetical protein
MSIMGALSGDLQCVRRDTTQNRFLAILPKITPVAAHCSVEFMHLEENLEAGFRATLQPGAKGIPRY